MIALVRRRTIGIYSLLLLALATTKTTSTTGVAGEKVMAQQRIQEEDVHYGLDVSFPVHGTVHVQNNPLGDRHQAYLHHLEGCRRTYSSTQGALCDRYENQRLLMNRRQPISMEVRQKDRSMANFQQRYQSEFFLTQIPPHMF